MLACPRRTYNIIIIMSACSDVDSYSYEVIWNNYERGTDYLSSYCWLAQHNTHIHNHKRLPYMVYHIMYIAEGGILVLF